MTSGRLMTSGAPYHDRISYRPISGLLPICMCVSPTRRAVDFHLVVHIDTQRRASEAATASDTPITIMPSPLSPRSFPTTSFLASGPASPPPTMSFPACPIEVQKRILHFALSLSPPHLSPKHASKRALAGQTARQRELRRVVERLGTHRSALTLMRVCKAWKVGHVRSDIDLS